MSGLKVNVKFEGQQHVDDFVMRVAPEAVEKASRQAMNKTIRKARTRSVRGISRASGIKPLKLIKQRTRQFLATFKRKAAGIYFDYAPMPFEALGEVKWSRHMPGARAGRYSFPGTFAATPRKGKHANKRRRIYTRVQDTNTPRQDLHAGYKMLEPFKNILGVASRRTVNQELLKTFGQQLAFHLRRGGYIK